MPQKYRDIFEKRAENGLMEYFELRAKQEDRAEQLKEEERKNVDTMLNESFGALQRMYHAKFFHETDGYNVTDRLERLTRVRAFISQYIYEIKLKHDPAYNWGDMLNLWINYAESNSKEDAIELFTEELKRIGLLRYDMQYMTTIDDALRAKLQPFVGTWVGYEDSVVLDVYGEPVEITDQITIEVFYNLSGRLSIRQTKQRVKYDGASVTGDPHVGGVSVKEGEFTVANATLTVPSDNAAGYSFKLKVSGCTMTSYAVHPWDGYETSITLTKKA